MYCIHCGRRQPVLNARFCPYCGAALSPPSARASARGSAHASARLAQAGAAHGVPDEHPDTGDGLAPPAAIPAPPAALPAEPVLQSPVLEVRGLPVPVEFKPRPWPVSPRGGRRILLVLLLALAVVVAAAAVVWFQQQAEEEGIEVEQLPPAPTASSPK